MSIGTEINRLLNYALQQGLLEEADRYYAANRLLALLHLDEYVPAAVAEELPYAQPVLDKLLDYAVQTGLIEDTVNERDLFDTALMDCVTPRPSEVIRCFDADYAQSPQKATEHYYQFSQATNYIRPDRIAKNLVWQADTEYGKLDVTINLSKPEKDPRDIAKAKQVKSSSYPRCLLCRENEGFAGHAVHPARQTHRLIPLQLAGRPWYLQYSPYTYYNEHCIVLNEQHVPMKVSRTTFENILDFLDYLPHYFLGSNVDLPIVGGSILSHDHYQGGHYEFAMAKATVEKEYSFKGFPEVKAGRIKWPMSALRLRSANRAQLLDLAEKILAKWRAYSDASVEVLAESAGEPHNTITPIGRRRRGDYEFDLVMRNNRTTKEHPLGLFHPHAEVHHIKKENIGLIEVMGLAVLPGRLRTEMAELGSLLVQGVEDISNNERLALHADWYRELRRKYPQVQQAEVKAVLQKEIGQVFATVLAHAGVFKRDEQGLAAFDRFVAAVNK